MLKQQAISKLISCLGRDPKTSTGIAFAMVEPDGERTFVVCARGAAHTRLNEDDLRKIEGLEPAATFVTGLLLLEEPSRTATMQVVERFRGRSRLYFDPNLRQPGSEPAVAMRSVARTDDVVLAGEEEIIMLSSKQGTGQVYTIKCGSRGSRLEHEGNPIAEASAHEVEAPLSTLRSTSQTPPGRYR